MTHITIRLTLSNPLLQHIKDTDYNVTHRISVEVRSKLRILFPIHHVGSIHCYFDESYCVFKLIT